LESEPEPKSESEPELAAIITVVVVDAGEHASLMVPSQDMDLEGVILHDPLQQIIGYWDPEMNGHLSKPIESFAEKVDSQSGYVSS
jgi:hypothetical protein